MNRQRENNAPADGLQVRITRRLRALQTRILYQFGFGGPKLGDVDVARDFKHPVNAEAREPIALRYRETFPDSVKAEITEARRLIEHRFTFLNHTMDHGKDIAWCLEPVSGREWDHGFSFDIPFRGPERLGDIKFPWELNKHQYFFTLGKAAWLTDDSSFATEIIWQIDSWIKMNPYLRGINWIDALQVGSRAISWIMAYPFYSDLCDVPFRRRMAGSLAQHLHFVEKHLSEGRFANNHTIGEATALVAGGMFLDCRRSQFWLKKGLTILDQEMKRQVTRDGVHAERSPGYHRFVLDHYVLVSSFLAANGLTMEEETYWGMEQMTEFLMDLLFPDGSAPAFGDCDDARGLWLRADCPDDYRSLLSWGAVIFERGDFKAVVGSITEEVLWLQGTLGIDKFMDLPLQLPTHTSAAYKEGGYYVMRGGWGAHDPVLIFDCGPVGYGPAGHGHADALSFQLFSDGYPFIVDSGTFSYNLDYEWRDAFRATQAHNTVVVDSQDQSVLGDRMSWKSMTTAHCHKWLSTHWFDFVDGEHDGYHRLHDSVTHRRFGIFLKPNLWVIWDHFTGNERHDLELLLHLRPDCDVEAMEGGVGEVLRSPEDARLYIRMLREGRQVVSPEVLIGSEEERTAWFSPGYGKRVPARALRLQHEFIGETFLVTCLSTSSIENPIFMKQEGIINVGVIRAEGFEENLFYRFHDNQRLETEDLFFDGELLYRRQSEELPSALWGESFRELSVIGSIEVRSAALIDSLAFEDDCCEIQVSDDHTSDVRVTVREGIRLMINGNPSPIDAKVI